jgi:hypothetical protein
MTTIAIRLTPEDWDTISTGLVLGLNYPNQSRELNHTLHQVIERYAAAREEAEENRREK